MRCPVCNAENPEGAATCASCGAAMGDAAAPVAVAAPEQPETAPEPAAVRPRRRLSKLAVVAIVAAVIAPWLQALAMESGGSWLGGAAASNWVVLMALDYGAYALFTLAIVTGLFALAHVLGRQRRRGGALALGGLLLAVGGMAGSIYGPIRGGSFIDLLCAMGGGTGRYAWQMTAIVVGAAVVCEVVLCFVGARAPTPEPEQTEAEPAAKA